MLFTMILFPIGLRQLKTGIAAGVQMFSLRLPLFALVLVLFSFAGVNHCVADSAGADGILPSKLLTITVEDSSGKTVAPFSGHRKAVCLIFISTVCPISNSYAPEISRISNQYLRSNIVTYAVVTDGNIKSADVDAYKSEYRLTCPVLWDRDHVLVKASTTAVTPEAVVYDSHLHMIYRGRIDNRYVDFGISREAATERDLRHILNEASTKSTVQFTESKAIGCFIPMDAS
jgi:hypothetical protein